MARTRNDAQHAARRAAILDAAATVFRAKGFHLARTEDICAAAGLSAGSLFRHFPDKRAIIDAIATREIEAYRDDLRQLATPDGIRWLAQVTAAELTQLLEPRAFQLGTDSWLELARDATGRQRLRELDATLRADFATALRRGQAEGWIRRSLDTDGAVTLVMALLSGLLFDAEIGLELHADATARAMSDLFRRFLMP